MGLYSFHGKEASGQRGLDFCKYTLCDAHVEETGVDLEVGDEPKRKIISEVA